MSKFNFFTISFIPYSEDELLPEGDYLVKTQSTSHLKTIKFVQARLTNVFNEKKGRKVNRVDVTNQIPLSITEKPVK